MLIYQAQVFCSLLFLGLIRCDSGIPSCKSSDTQCLLKGANVALPLIIAGDPSLGVESSDPLYHDFIYADLAGLKYNFSSVTVRGFSSCYVESIRLDAGGSKLNTGVTCALQMEGNYDTSGRLLILPIEGHGKFNIRAEKILITIEAQINQANKDGRSYLHIKSYSYKINPLEKIVFYLENLFNGNKELGDAVLNFANQNYKEISNEVGGPIYKANLRKIVNNINKYLKASPSISFKNK